MTHTHFGEAEDVTIIGYWIKPMIAWILLPWRGWIYRQIKETYDDGIHKHRYYYVKREVLYTPQSKGDNVKDEKKKNHSSSREM